jgi:hypothetical protein
MIRTVILHRNGGVRPEVCRNQTDETSFQRSQGWCKKDILIAFRILWRSDTPCLQGRAVVSVKGGGDSDKFVENNKENLLGTQQR